MTAKKNDKSITEREDWQIADAMNGSFRIVTVAGQTIDRRFNAQYINVNPQNTRFFVRLHVRGALTPFEHTLNVHIIHGSGESADFLAVKNTIKHWLEWGVCGVTIATLTVTIDDKG